MGGFFGVVSETSCTNELFFGVDYHSHLGTRRGGMVVYDPESGFHRSIHNIEHAPFRTKFEGDLEELEGTSGIGCISDNEPQPLMIKSHLGSYAITTVGLINNLEELAEMSLNNGFSHYLEMSSGKLNATEVVASLINQKSTLVEGIRYVQELVKGSISLLILTPEGIFAARDRMGRTPVVIGKKEGAYCVSFESFAQLNLGYHTVHELGPMEIAFVDSKGYETVQKPQEEMKICSFLWVYYGYPTSCYEGINVEEMRYRCGDMLARRDNDIGADIVAGVPDSGIPHAIGYANRSGIPFARPFIKYTPTWSRSFMPTHQSRRNLVAKMKLIPVQSLINGKSMLLIDDSIVRGTQLGETTEFLYESGAKEVHIRPACPPLMFGCKYLNFSRSKSEMDLITRRVIMKKEGKITPELLEEYSNPDSPKYDAMLVEIRKELNFTSLRYHRLDDMIESIGIPGCKLCTYCWNGKE